MNDKKLPNARFIDVGEMCDVFADDLATIEEFGSVTHIVFARYGRSGENVHREAVLRLIIPTELRIAMGRRFMAGSTAVDTSTATENSHLH
jgi:hypothetical protein